MEPEGRRLDRQERHALMVSISMVVAVLVLGWAMIAFMQWRAKESSRDYETCLKAAERFSLETGWQPDGGIAAWCVYNTRGEG